MAMSFNSPNRSPGSARLQLGAVSRLRSSSQKKPPEPLRRAVADCLSSSSSTSFSSHQGGVSSVFSEAARTLRDYLASSSTTDLAYSIILEHTLAERERSPAVVGKCVSLLKCNLLRYKPSEDTLLQIDRFCVSIIAECDPSSNRRASQWSRPLNQQSVGGSTTSNVLTPLPVSSFAAGENVKSLNYVRSLVTRHVPKRSFQPAVFAGVPSTSRQSLPSLSSMLSRSFNSQVNTGNNGEPSDNKDASTMSVLNQSIDQNVDALEDLEYIALDLLKRRWPGDHQSSCVPADSYSVVNSQDISKHSLLEVSAASLLVGDMEAKMKGQPWRQSGTADMPGLDQLLQPSSVTTAANFVSARSHLRAITASKRTKLGPHQIWEDSMVSTFRPRARQLFQYRHYSEQQPLRLNPAEVYEVIAAVCSETSFPNNMTISSRLSNNSGKPSVDVAVSVLIKLVIDMYVMDPGTAAPLTLSMLEEMLCSPRSASRARAFDLVLNLGVHAQLLEPLMSDDTLTIDEEYAEEPYYNNEAHLATQGKRTPDSPKKIEPSSAISNFESWILGILYETLLLLIQIEEKEESVWASALSCLLYFICDRGKIWRNKLQGLDIRVIKALLEISRNNSWAEVVHCKLICMLTNMFYEVSDGTVAAASNNPTFLVDQIDLIGGIEFICLEYSLTSSIEERRNLYLVLFDYVIHQINESCTAAGVSEYSADEIQPLATLLTTHAPEAVYLSVKLGLEGIGEILARSVSVSLSRYPNSERLNKLLEEITGKFDTILSSFTHLDKEFCHMIQRTKSYKYLKSIEDGIFGNSVSMKAKLSWAILHSLLHSDRIAYRRNGYIWLGELLMAEISDGRDSNIWLNIRNLQQKIVLAGVHDSLVSPDTPLPISIMCELLKSKHNLIRWGFLFVLERLLVRSKILLDEKNQRDSSSGADGGQTHGESGLDRANAVIDIMSSALSLVAQINETDRLNILKMCDILFSQLCLKVPPTTAMPSGDAVQLGKIFSFTDANKVKGSDWVTQKEIWHRDAFLEGNDNIIPLFYETSSMAAMLLQGRAFVPMQLVARVPAVLFYWPLIQLAGAATDDIALGVAVGSKGRGNLPGATSDIRATLLLLLIGKCTADPASFQEVGGEEFFRELLDDTDSRVAYYSSAFLLQRMMTEEPGKYQRMLQNLVLRAQQSNNEKLLENPFLQMRGIIQLSNDIGTGL